jgi:hypothetical protein
LFPISSGIAADHAVVPDAAPEPPKLVAQETSVTPTLSLAVPAMVKMLAVVDMVPVEGEVIFKLGAVVSAPPPETAEVRTTVMVLESWLPAAVAVMVMTFVPTTSGTFAIAKGAEPAAIPDALPVDHVTVIAPDPPVADPDKLTLDAVVDDIAWFSVNAREAAAGGTTT